MRHVHLSYVYIYRYMYIAGPRGVPVIYIYIYHVSIYIYTAPRGPSAGGPLDRVDRALAKTRATKGVLRTHAASPAGRPAGKQNRGIGRAI